MKYLLNESIKFNLSERFILTEAPTSGPASTTIDQCEKICEYLKGIIQELNGDTHKNDDKEEAFEKLFNYTDTLMINIRNIKDVETVKGKAKDYITTVQAIVDLVKSVTYTEKGKTNTVGAFFADLNSLITSSGTKLNDLKSELAKINIVLKAAKEGLASITSSANQKYDKGDQLAIFTKAYQIASKLTKLTDSEYTSNKEQINKHIPGLYDAIFNKKASQTEILSLCDDLVKKGNFDSLTVAGQDDTAAEKELTKDDDWDLRFKNTPDKKLFWADYYKAAWGANAAKIESLGEAFRQECSLLGFTEVSNPFIGFIKRYITGEIAPSQKYPVDIQHYEAIHNAIAQHKLSRKDITDKPSGSITLTNNIIFYRDFYDKPGSDAPAYLDALSQLRNIKISELSLDNDTLASNLQGASGNSQETFIAVILTNNIPLKELVNSTISAAITPNIGDKLRPITDLKQLLTALGAAELKPAWKPETTDKLVAAIKTDFGTNPAAWAKRIVCYIADSQDNDGTKVTKIDEYNKKYAWWKSIALTPDAKTAIINELAHFGSNIEWKMLDNIIKAFEKEEDASNAGKSWLGTDIK